MCSEKAEGDHYGGGEEVGSQAAERAQAAEQAQHGAAARAALRAAYTLAGNGGTRKYLIKLSSNYRVLLVQICWAGGLKIWPSPLIN